MILLEYACAIPLRRGQVLLGLRAAHRRNFPGVWDLIGGHVEAGETPAETARRELEEEVGLRVVALGSGETIEVLEMDQRTRTRCHVFIVRDWAPAEPVLANDEHAELRWFDLDEAECLQPLAAEAYRTVFRSLRPAPL